MKTRESKRASVLPMLGELACQPHHQGGRLHPGRPHEIYETAPDQRLVTSKEVLSASNKRPGTPGWDLYRRKRQSHLLGDVNLVEIDLLRGGQRLPMLDPWPDSPYTVLVARAKKPQLCKVWRVDLQRPLPPIPVPLAKPDADVQVSLQPLIDTIYKRFRYWQSIDYTRPLTPPLHPEKSDVLPLRSER